MVAVIVAFGLSVSTAARAQNGTGGSENQGTGAEVDSQSDNGGNDGEQSKDDSDKGESKSGKGPGGRQLRTDYPGTDEAMKGQMETQPLEGLQFEEGKKQKNPHVIEMRELRTRVDNLKEEVFRSKSRIAMLKERVLSGRLSGSRAVIVHISDLGAQYKLRRVAYSIDGERVFNETDRDGSLSSKDKFEVYNGVIEPGHHVVSLLLKFRGSGLGIFNYMQEYKFKVQDSCEFEAVEGKNSIVEIRLTRTGNFLTQSYEKRPAVKCKVHTVDYTKKGAAKNVSGSKSK